MFPGLRDDPTQVGASVGALDDGVLAGIVEDWAFGERNVCRDTSDWYSERREGKKTSDNFDSSSADAPERPPCKRCLQFFDQTSCVRTTAS